MGFFEDLKRTVDSVLGVPARGGILGEDQYLNRDGVHPMSSDGLKAPSSDPYGLDLADAIAIKQRGTIGFNTVNITPRKLSLTAFPLALSKNKLYDIVGSDADDAGLSKYVGVEAPPAYQPIKFWRTVPLSIMGNFLKLEMLPTKINYANNGIDSGISFVNAENPATFNENNTGNTYDRTLIYSDNEKVFESSPVILVQFESLDAGIMVIKPGDVFKLPFTQVFITVKCGSPRFQLIYGYNSEIISDSQNRVMNSNPAFGPGRALWDSPSRHCVPFCMGYGSVANAHSVFADQSWYLVGAGDTYTDHYLMTNSSYNVGGVDITPEIEGVSHGWITSLGIRLVFTNSNVADRYEFYFCVRVVGREVSDVSNDRAGKSKPLIMIPLLIYSTGGAVNESVEKSFSIPVRFTLRKGEMLLFSTHAILPAGRDAKVTWNMQGYTFGKLTRGGPVVGSYKNNVLTMDCVTESAFPLDQDDGIGKTWTPGFS